MILFITTFLISFLGSIHPGPLNVSVVDITLKKNFKAGVIMAIGGVIPEIIYGIIAIEGLFLIGNSPKLAEILNYFSTGFLIVLGLFTIFKNEKTIALKSNQFKKSFIKGFLLSITNFQLLAFWLLILVSFKNYEFLKITTPLHKVLFVLGTSLGAFTLNYIYAFWAFKKRDFILAKLNKKVLNILIGGSFIVMALIQILKQK